MDLYEARSIINEARYQLEHVAAALTDLDVPPGQTLSEAEIEELAHIVNGMKLPFPELSLNARVQLGREACFEVVNAVVDALRPRLSPVRLTAEDVKWVVNSNAELGVEINGQFFFLYKGESLVYTEGPSEGRRPLEYRPVFKREFGEVCTPINHEDYSMCGTVNPNDSDDWKVLPLEREQEF
ncbi:hypothetical protein BcepSauron_178 [Burkholderia phage BcepSauron]|uniref:Uncharacterized protein n=1 Tax=Burkholderia phage BcepSauron TaxID=2530033 RepID=A0A482MLN9_9CAUD|nr:hypothetical protein H1O17_gp178 [Burkholderia phage BcepSauron]QBQ74558.1 hypothetical protein BcepSauron_178 [Burkholderia phage BcepSauron]